MRSRDLLLYAYEQIQSTLRRAIQGLDADQLTRRVRPEANSIAWLAWHLLRVQDDHVADVAGSAQVWTAAGFAQRFGLPFEQAIVFDWRRCGRPHPVYLYGGAALLAVKFLNWPISMTPAWHSFAGGILALAQ